MHFTDVKTTVVFITTSRTQNLLLVAWGLTLVTLIGSLTPVASQVFPINTFTIADGLAHNGVTDIWQDGKGYLWIGTGEGLSRFDGYVFRNYGTADGLPSSYVNDIAVDRNGVMWVAINDGGIVRFVPDPDKRRDDQAKKFVAYSISDLPRAENVGQIVFDPNNRLWCATEGGVFRARNIDVAPDDFELVAPEGEATSSRAALADSRGRLWFGSVDRILQIQNDRPAYFDLEPGRGSHVNSISEADGGRLIASTDVGIFEFIEVEQVWRKIPIHLDPGQSITNVSPGENGLLRIATNKGLIEYRGDGQQMLFTSKNGLPAASIALTFRDRQGGIWFGTRGRGVGHQTSLAIVSYNHDLPSRPSRIFADSEGSVLFQAGCHPQPTKVAKFTSEGVVSIPFPDVRREVCGRNHFLPTTDGRWWLISDGQLSVFSSLTSTSGVPVFLPDGRPVETFTSLYEDSERNVWLTAGDRNLYVARPRSDTSPVLELAARDVGASIVIRDSHGIVWLAKNTFFGRLRNGELEEINEIPAVGKLQPRSLFEDSKGRIWIGTRFDGALFTDNPDSDVPEFKQVPPDALGSETVWSIAEDGAGGVYLGTGRGLARYDLERGIVRRFTSADSFPEAAVSHIFRDRAGYMWVASDAGLQRIDPRILDKNLPPPPVLISRITVEGTDLDLPEDGIGDIALSDLPSTENSVSVQFLGLNLRGEASLRYTYLLEGYDDRWSTPTRQRELNFANLSAGSYRFLVRAIDQRGVESEVPAMIQFTILRPFWQRWWFVTLALIAVGVTLYALYRYRMARVVEVERVRTRIATDLHDDIGSNLTRIALMSEVLKQNPNNESAGTMLPSIANIARESVASMNDIVWAISPEHDRVLDLTRRMRQHAEEVFTIRDIDVEFVSDAMDSELKLPVGIRRDVLLIFKEAVNNAARHSDCTKVVIEFTCGSSRLSLKIVDNGRGFLMPSEREGHGLTSMARRASSLDGTLDIESEEGVGTTVRFEMPL